MTASEPQQHISGALAPQRTRTHTPCYPHTGHSTRQLERGIQGSPPPPEARAGGRRAQHEEAT
jgi:hypothetical protein